MSKLKISIAIATLIALAFFNRGLDRGRSAEQRAFDSWAGSVTTSEGAERALAVQISVELSSPAGSNSFKISGADSTERLQRLLELLSVSNIFSEPQADTVSPGAIQIEVTDPDKRFATIVTPEFVSSSVPAQSFLKLLTIYAGDKPLNEITK